MKTSIFTMYYITLHNLFHTQWNNIPVAGDSTVDPSGHFDYICSYSSTDRWGLCWWKATMLIFNLIYFKALSKKRALAVTLLLHTAHRVKLKIVVTYLAFASNTTQYPSQQKMLLARLSHKQSFDALTLWLQDNKTNNNPSTLHKFACAHLFFLNRQNFNHE